MWSGSLSQGLCRYTIAHAVDSSAGRSRPPHEWPFSDQCRLPGGDNNNNISEPFKEPWKGKDYIFLI